MDRGRPPALVVQLPGASRPDSVRQDIIAGLTAPAPWVAPKHLYGPLGSRLFEAITALPEYYPTRIEKALLVRHAGDIARLAGPAPTMVDLGAGNCEKAKGLFAALRPRQYVAADISAEFLQDALSVLQAAFPDMNLLGLAGDFSSGLVLPDSVGRENRLFFYPGSSIGNFAPNQALDFLALIRGQCSGGGLLIGVDLVKPASILEPAYDDALGVTAAFNLNLLNNLNGLIGSDFDVTDWRHRAFYNAPLSRIEMHLEARREAAVRWPGGERVFRKGQRIHTENSYKYALKDFKALLRQAGFGKIAAWTDERRWFALCHAGAG